jgi:hypothetical protein
VKRLAIVIGAVAVAVTTAVIVAIALPTGPSDQEENERILQALPVYPGAQLLEVTENPYFDCRWPFRRLLGHNTTALYRVPTGTSAETVVQFYIENLREGWTSHREDIGIAAPVPAPGMPTPGPSYLPTPGSIPQARFVKGTAVVHVGTENMAFFPGQPPGSATHDFSVNVDAEGTVERPYCD